MKRKLFYVLLALEAAACVALCLAKDALPNLLTVAVAFPFEQLGLGLRALSLAGRFGNAAALALYAAFCLLPAGYLFFIRSKRGWHAEDALPVLVSALLFAVVYLMINPREIGARLPFPGESGLVMGKAVLGSVIYSVLIGYVVLRALRLAFESGSDRLYASLSVLLALMSLLFVWAVFYMCFGDMVNAFAALEENAVSVPGVRRVFVALRFLAGALPYALDFFIVLVVRRLFDEMRADRYSDAAVSASRRLSRWCAGALAATVVTNIGFNVLQLLCAKALTDFNSTLNLPLTSILFALAALLFSRIVAENQKLKRDSDLII
ncbi:MAG TPA: hypothetical protein VN540_10885 [Clostridia bacterium]|nr:hypothetical protein [Clostridia bacterium]